MLWYIYYDQRLWVIPSIAWNVSTIRLLYFPQVTTFDLFLQINFEQITSGRGWMQNSSTRFMKNCGLAVQTSNITKLGTCGCGFKDKEVADLRLRIQEFWNVAADLRLRTKLLNVLLRTCGCGLRKLKFGCGSADLKKSLRCPALQILGAIGYVIRVS